MARKINVAIVGMGFGAEFAPIYQRHPNTNMYAICQRNKAHLDEVGDKFGICAHDSALRGAAAGVYTRLTKDGGQTTKA